MRTLFKHIAWGLATAAMIIATPIRAAAFTGSPSATSSTMQTPHTVTASPQTTSGTTSAVAVRSALASSFARAFASTIVNTAAAPNESGAGWKEAYCLGCIALGTFALYTGGITMLPVILANPAAYGTFTGTCIVACESVIQQLAS